MPEEEVIKIDFAYLREALNILYEWYTQPQKQLDDWDKLDVRLESVCSKLFGPMADNEDV